MDEEAEVDVSSALVTHPKPSELVPPGQRALHHPAVPSQPLLGFDSWLGNAWGDTTPAQPSSVLLRGVGFIAVDLARPELTLAGGHLHRGHGVEQWEEFVRVVYVRSPPSTTRPAAGHGPLREDDACYPPSLYPSDLGP